MENLNKQWATDADYVKAQDNTSWSHRSAWGKNAANNFLNFGGFIKSIGRKITSVADFGGNDGYAAYQFSTEFYVDPIVLDCEPKRLKFCKDNYGLSTIRCFIEDTPLDDKSVGWVFCSHTIEHTRDPAKALREIARIVKEGAYFVFPNEKHEHGKLNPAHAINCETLSEWVKLVNSNNLSVKGVLAGYRGGFESIVYAEPTT